MILQLYIERIEPPLNITEVHPISFPEHVRSQVKGGHSSGEIELIYSGLWLANGW
jgi:hypothetical protein